MKQLVKRICGVVHRKVACSKCHDEYWLGPESFKRSAVGFICEDCSDSMSIAEHRAMLDRLLDHIQATRPDIIEQVEKETGEPFRRRKK